MPAHTRAADVLGMGGMTPTGGAFVQPAAPGGLMNQEQIGGLGVSGAANVDVSGTPSRVALMLLGAGALLAALKVSGFRFNVGVSN